jgi:ribonuclease HI
MAQSALIYCDGACSGNPGSGGWGAVVRLNDRVFELGGRAPKTTNNRMELQAAIESLAHVPLDVDVEVRTDSKYLVQGAKEWLAGWKRRGWKRADGGEVLNQDLWQLLDALLSGRSGRTTFTYVAGHAGIDGNERADAIARGFCSGVDAPHLFDGPASAYTVGLDATGAKTKAASTAKPFYVSVIEGRLERHSTWDECEKRVRGKSGAKYKKVSSETELEAVLIGWGMRK